MKLFRQLFLVSVFLLTGVSLVEAHAFVDHADPPVGGTIHVSPATIKIWFTRKLDPASSKIQAFNSQGMEVDQHDVRLDVADSTLLLVSVPKLATGTYKVVWQAVCLDTHTTHGSFVFKVEKH